MDKSLTGKKIFFLYPQSVIQDEMIYSLLEHGYEVYIIKDHIKALSIFREFDNSICFINIDYKIKGSGWEEYITAMKNDPATKNIQIGILSYNNDPNLKKKFLLDLGVECGFVQLKLGIKQSEEIILKVLEANEAKGRRKFVRVYCGDDPRVLVKINYQENDYEGQIIDLSSVGIACKFSSAVPASNKEVLKNIQLNLRGSLLTVDGIILGRRNDDEKILIILFNPRPSEKDLEKIYMFIHRMLQRSIDEE